MPVNEYGRNGDRTTTVYTRINIANLTNSFLRRDGGNTAIEAIDMNSNIIQNMYRIHCQIKMLQRKIMWTQTLLLLLAVLSDDIKLYVGSDLVRSLGCNDLTTGKKFTLPLGTERNMLTYSMPNSGLPVPIKIKAGVCFGILINELPVYVFGQDEILCSRPIDMDQHSIKNVMSPVNKLDADNKAYADRITYKTVTGNIPNTVMTDHTLFTFPAVKAFASRKIKLCEMWVKRLAEEWISTSSPMFATEWPGFHKFSRGPSLMTFFTGSPPVVGLALFASTI